MVEKWVGHLDVLMAEVKAELKAGLLDRRLVALTVASRVVHWVHSTVESRVEK